MTIVDIEYGWLVMKHALKKCIILFSLWIVFIPSTVVITVPGTVVKEQWFSSPRNQYIILEDGFEEGYMPPTGWTRTVTNPDYTWKIVTDPVHTGTYAAQCPRSNNAQDEWLTTPEIDLTYYYVVEITFWSNTTLTTAPGMMVDLVVQGDGINDVVWSVVNETEWTTYAWREKTIDLSAYVGYIITISWHYYGSVGKKNFGLDDILIFSPNPNVLPLLEIGAITGGCSTITAEIKNNNNYTGMDALNVTWEISVRGHGLLRLINESATGTIPFIPHNGGVEVVNMTRLYGLAKVNVTVKAAIPDNPNVIPVEKSIKGIVFLIFVVLPKE